MSKKPSRCDACNRRIRLNQHELKLSDLTTGQLIGRYHATPACQEAAAAYVVGGAALRGTYHHPRRCGADLESCDGGLLEWGAA